MSTVDGQFNLLSTAGGGTVTSTGGDKAFYDTGERERRGSPAWWSRDDDTGARIAKTPSPAPVARGQPSPSKQLAVEAVDCRLRPAYWRHQTDTPPPPPPWTTPPAEDDVDAGTRRGVAGAFLADDDVVRTTPTVGYGGRPSSSVSYHAGSMGPQRPVGPMSQAPLGYSTMPAPSSPLGLGVDGGGSLGHSYNNPYRHDSSMRVDGSRTLTYPTVN